MLAFVRKNPLLIIGFFISVVLVVAYASVGFASLSSPKAIWKENPIGMSFLAGTEGSSITTDSVKCAPKVADVVFRPTISNPLKVSLTVGPTETISCGPTPVVITLTVRCLVSASSCRGAYSGTISIFRGYDVIPPNLVVTVTVG